VAREVAAFAVLVQTLCKVVRVCCIGLDFHRIQAVNLHSTSDHDICKHRRAAAGCGSAGSDARGAGSDRLAPGAGPRTYPAGPATRQSSQPVETKVLPCPSRALPTAGVR
jgi:hypothetical protein